MYEIVTIREVLAGAGLAGVAVLALMYFLRVFVTKMSEGSLSIKSSSTQIELIEALQGEIRRIKSDISEIREEHTLHMNNLKKIHDHERNEWKKKLERIERQFIFLKNRNACMRSEALDAYTFIATREDLLGVVYAEELKERLLRIIADDNKEHNNDSK